MNNTKKIKRGWKKELNENGWAYSTEIAAGLEWVTVCHKGSEVVSYYKSDWEDLISNIEDVYTLMDRFELDEIKQRNKS